MSVILESLPGYPIYCIATFYAWPEGADRLVAPRQEIHVGDRVSYVASSEDEHFKDHPARWRVTFDTPDGRRFTAVDSLFVTEDDWERLEEFFRQKLLAKPSPANGPPRQAVSAS
jgi:hypothetical protein